RYVSKPGRRTTPSNWEFPTRVGGFPPRKSIASSRSFIAPIRRTRFGPVPALALPSRAASSSQSAAPSSPPIPPPRRRRSPPHPQHSAKPDPELGTRRMPPNPLKGRVADDEPPIRKLLRTGLGTQGYQTLDAPNAKTALELMSDKPDLVILDLGLPDMRGLD